MNVNDKFETVEHFLKFEHPRYANNASARMVADNLDVGLSGLISTSLLDGAFRRAKSALADNYADAINAFFARNPEWCCQQAYKEAVADALERDAIIEPTDEDLEELLDPGNYNNVLGLLEKSPSAVQAETDEYARQNLISAILDSAEPLRTNTGDREAERAKANARAAWIQKVKQSSVEDLRRIREKQQLRQTDSADLHKAVKVVDKQRQQAFSRFPVLPPTYVPPGKLEGVPWSSQLLKRLAVVAPKEFRRLLEMFGSEQIDAVLNGVKQ